MDRKIIVYGATLAALGIASVYKQNCIIINHGYNCAYEYAETFRTSKISDFGLSDKALDFANDLKSRNILKDGFVNPMMLAGIAAEYFKKFGATVYLGATLQSATDCGKDVEVCFFVDGEKRTLRSDIYIDTTDFGTYNKFIKASLFTKLCNPDVNKFEFLDRGRFENEYYLKLDANGKTYSHAVEDLNNLWMNKLCTVLPDFRMVATANEFCTEYEKPICEKHDNVIHIPSASYENAAKSFEGGLKCASLL